MVPFRSDVDSLAEQLSMAGFEVEEQDDLAARAAGVVVGKVLSKPHPDANKLNVCLVSVGAGAEPLQIVCGAANVREGMAVAVATVGSHLPAVDLPINRPSSAALKAAKCSARFLSWAWKPIRGIGGPRGCRC